MERPATTQELLATERTRALGSDPGQVADGTYEQQGSDPLGRGSGLVLGRYRLERILGSGGFGVVWLARDERLQRDVAVKVIPSEPHETAGGRGAEREARAAARLNHPGVVALYELDHDEHSTYLVSELVRGRTFAELGHAGALSDSDVARIGLALCEALAHAHERGVIHRDVKPQNVMVLAEPAAGAGFAKLADFGVAHLASGDALTRTGDIVGTLAYMAPEQAEGLRVTPAADVYSLALTLYEAWTGVNPIRGHGPASTARRLGRRLPRLGDRRADLPVGAVPRSSTRASTRTRSAARTSPSCGTPWRSPSRPSRTRAAWSSRPPSSALASPPRIARWCSGSQTPRAPCRRASARVWERHCWCSSRSRRWAPRRPSPAPRPPGSRPRSWRCCRGSAGSPPLSAVVLWLASPEAGREGTALVLAAGFAPVPFLLPRAGVLWSVPALAPLLGVVALAPIFVALAGLCSTAWRRAGLAAAGFGWLLLAEVMTGDALLFGPPDGVAPRAEWEGSIQAAASDALYPLLSSPATAPAVIWVLLAIVLPLLVRGRSLFLDLLAAGTWAAALVAAHAALGDLLAASVELDQARGAVGGAILAAVVAVAAAALGLLARPVEREPLP